MDSKRIRMEAAASIELECLNDTSSSLKQKLKHFGRKTRHSVHTGSRKHNKQAVAEILIQDKPNLKKEDFNEDLLCDVEVANVHVKKSKNYIQNKSMFSTPTQANNLSFLDNNASGSTMTQFETQPPTMSRFSKQPRPSGTQSSFDDQIQVTNESSTIQRQVNTSLGWVDTSADIDFNDTQNSKKARFINHRHTFWN